MRLQPTTIVLFTFGTCVREIKKELQEKYDVFKINSWEINSFACGLKERNQVEEVVKSRGFVPKKVEEIIYFDVRKLKSHTNYRMKMSYKKTAQKIRTGSSFGEDGNKMDYSYIRNGKAGKLDRYINSFSVEYFEEISEDEAKQTVERNKRMPRGKQDFEIGDYVRLYWDEEGENTTKALILNYKRATDEIVYLNFRKRERKYIYTNADQLKNIKGIEVLKGSELKRFKIRVDAFMTNVISTHPSDVDPMIILNYFKIKVDFQNENSKLILQKEGKEPLVISLKSRKRKEISRELWSDHNEQISSYLVHVNTPVIASYMEKHEFNKMRNLL